MLFPGLDRMVVDSERMRRVQYERGLLSTPRGLPRLQWPWDERWQSAELGVHTSWGGWMRSTPRFPKTPWEIMKNHGFSLLFHENPSKINEK